MSRINVRQRDEREEVVFGALTRISKHADDIAKATGLPCVSRSRSSGTSLLAASS